MNHYITQLLNYLQAETRVITLTDAPHMLMCESQKTNTGGLFTTLPETRTSIPLFDHVCSKNQH